MSITQNYLGFSVNFLKEEADLQNMLLFSLYRLGQMPEIRCWSFVLWVAAHDVRGRRLCRALCSAMSEVYVGEVRS